MPAGEFNKGSEQQTLRQILGAGGLGHYEACDLVRNSMNDNLQPEVSYYAQALWDVTYNSSKPHPLPVEQEQAYGSDIISKVMRGLHEIDPAITYLVFDQDPWAMTSPDTAEKIKEAVLAVDPKYTTYEDAVRMFAAIQAAKADPFSNGTIIDAEEFAAGLH